MRFHSSWTLTQWGPSSWGEETVLGVVSQQVVSQQVPIGGGMIKRRTKDEKSSVKDGIKG